MGLGLAGGIETSRYETKGLRYRGPARCKYPSPCWLLPRLIVSLSIPAAGIRVFPIFNQPGTSEGLRNRIIIENSHSTRSFFIYTRHYVS